MRRSLELRFSLAIIVAFLAKRTLGSSTESPINP